MTLPTTFANKDNWSDLLSAHINNHSFANPGAAPNESYRGIGIVPTASLHVFHATDSILAKFESGGTVAGINFKNSTNEWNLLVSGGQIRFSDVTGGSINSFVLEAGAPADTIRIKGDGKIGIGIATPSRVFHVQTADQVVTRLESTDQLSRLEILSTGRNWGIETNGTTNLFSIIDITGGTTPFSIDEATLSSTLRLKSGGNLLYKEITAAPSNPTADTELSFYMKNDKIVFQFNDAGTQRYYTLDLQAETGAWSHSTTAP